MIMGKSLNTLWLAAGMNDKRERGVATTIMGLSLGDAP
jgi:hypothetical protein